MKGTPFALPSSRRPRLDPARLCHRRFCAVPATPTAAASGSAADRLISVTRQQIGDRYVFGAVGPRTFDCSGLVLYALKKSGNGQGHPPWPAHSARYLSRVQEARQGEPDEGRPGDLVVWGRSQHMGVYLGHGMAISALSSRGVRMHKVSAFSAPFTAFLHTGLATR